MPTPKNQTQTTPIISSEFVIWEGPNIPCIDLCTGEKVSGVIAKIGEKLCTLVSDIKELETLDYTCMNEKFNYSGDLLTPEKFSFKLLFQLLLKNDCTLQELIDKIPTTNTTTSVNLDGLNLSCITNEILNLCGQKPVNLDVLKVTQAIINVLCGLQDDVADILIRLITIETRLDTLGNPGSGGYTEPEITSCLSTLDGLGNPIPVLMRDHIVNLTDNAVCDLKELVGTDTQVNEALNRQCLSDYANNNDIIKNASSLAESLANKEIIICDLIDRITLIENTCCSFGCDDIRIGFTQSYNATSNKYTIEFTNGAGTNIPPIFTDCGSTFILTDWKGITKTINNNPANPLTQLTSGSTFVISLSGSGLDPSKPINLQIKTCFTNITSGLICKDCFGGTLDESSKSTATTCWEFVVPKTDVLGCGNKFINYDSLTTTAGVFTCSTSNTSQGNPIQNLITPIFSTPNNILNNVICNNNSVMLTLSGQSTITPPELKLAITNTSPVLYINVIGTLNTSCLC